MKTILKDFGSYKLHLIKTKKFKSVSIKVSFRRPIVKEDITMRNILAEILIESTKNYPSKKSLVIKSQELYSTNIHISNSRLGNYITTDFSLSCLNDKYTEKNNLIKGIEFLSEVIFNPDVTNGEFNKDKLEIIKSYVKEDLESIKENTSLYSLLRMVEEYDDKLPLSYRMIGYLEDLDKINAKNLYEYYQKILKEDLIDIFVIGDISFDEMTEMIKKHFDFTVLKKVKEPFQVKQRKTRKIIKEVKETVSSSQSQLSIGCNISNLTEYQRNYPLTLYNIILGGGSNSKLFKEVREENSLCYTISSIPNKLDNVIIVRAGIDKENYKKAINIIEKCFSKMKKGDFTDEDISIAKEYYNTALDEIEESQYRIVQDCFMKNILNTDDIDIRRKNMNKVTREEIIDVAKNIKIDTIFLLEGDSNE